MTVLTSLASRLRTARLYLCTDARQRQGDLAEFLTAAVAGGVDIVQIRQPHLGRSEELAALEVAREVARTRQVVVAVNEDLSVAEAFAADMLHLGHRGSARRARRHLHEWALLGRSASTPEQVDAALADREVDYISVGPVRATPSAPGHAAVGLDLIRHAARVAPVADLDATPWFAVGGIDLDTLDAVLEAGARRVVVVRAITEADDPQAAAAALKDRLRTAWAADPAMASYALRAARFGLS